MAWTIRTFHDERTDHDRGDEENDNGSEANVASPYRGAGFRLGGRRLGRKHRPRSRRVFGGPDLDLRGDGMLVRGLVRLPCRNARWIRSSSITVPPRDPLPAPERGQTLVVRSTGLHHDAQHLADLLEREVGPIAQVEDLALPDWATWRGLDPDGEPITHRISPGPTVVLRPMSRRPQDSRRKPPPEAVLVHGQAIGAQAIGPGARVVDRSLRVAAHATAEAVPPGRRHGACSSVRPWRGTKPNRA